MLLYGLVTPVDDEDKLACVVMIFRGMDDDWKHTASCLGRGGRTFLNPIAAKKYIYYMDIYNIYTKIANKEFEKPLPPLPCGRIHHH